MKGSPFLSAGRLAAGGGGRLVLPVVLCATFVQLLNVTVAQIAAPAIRADLGAGSGAMQLIPAGYTLTCACLLITAARLGDRYGYHRLFALGTVVFMAGSVAAACAPDATFLIAARLVQGAGSGLVAPQVLSIIQVAVPAARRPRALGLFGATMGVASLDGVGVSLTTVGFGALVLPLARGGEAGRPWWTWATLAVSAAVLGCFALTLPHRPDPLVHPSLFRDRRARAGMLLVFVFNSGVPSFTYLLFLHLQSAIGYPALTAALTSAPFAAAAVLGSRSAPALARRHGSAVLTVPALVLAGTALALAPLIGTAAGRWAALPVLALGGAAFGSFTASVFASVLARVDGSAAGSVSGPLPTAQQLGGSIGVAAAGPVYFAPAAGPGAAFRHAMTYEAAVFTATAPFYRAFTVRALD
ncbi:MFS transporter [Streptomyces sp. NPDC059101]|uniref:MFS transporter n=1 Tax=Streptomyces sp. NPDC059101 TaxID=3346728 RepID=UPI0036BAECC5